MNDRNVQVDDLVVDPSFIAYVQKTDPRAVAYWQKMIGEQPDNRGTYQQAERMITSLMFDISNEEVEEAGMRLKHAVMVSQSTTPTIDSISSGRSIRFRWYRYAAILVSFSVAAFVLGFFISRYGDSQNPLLSKNTNDWIIKQTSRGQKSTITLKDGSQIRLNSETKVSIPEIFSSDFREVRVEGEAFFDVSHDPHHPFIVYSNNTITKVLGTSFNVKAYPENDYTSIALVRGKVAVSFGQEKDSVYLKPNEILKVSKMSVGHTKEVFDPKRLTAWKDGIIRFHEVRFDDMVKTLERWYDVEFVIHSYPTVKAFSGEFNDESLEEVLKGISFSLEFNYKLDGKKVYIN